jgi:DNA (cytosine-5)-methyltransferase 1
VSRPRLLDLYCGAGGASAGYHRAGFDVEGVDLHPQPSYPWPFRQADALTVDLDGFSTIAKQSRTRYEGLEHPDLVALTRARLVATGRPYIIENVPGAPLVGAFQLCGTMFDLGADDMELRRHRIFEVSPALDLLSLPRCTHGYRPRTVGVYGHPGGSSRRDGVKFASFAQWQEAMEIDWMPVAELAESIPPAYTEWIAHLLAQGLGLDLDPRSVLAPPSTFTLW